MNGPRIRSQLQRDLERRVRERLRLWASDSVELFEMAELEDEAAAAVMTTLLWFIGTSFAKVGMSPERAAQLLCDAMRDLEKYEKTKQRKRD